VGDSILTEDVLGAVLEVELEFILVVEVPSESGSEVIFSIGYFCFEGFHRLVFQDDVGFSQIQSFSIEWEVIT
jgi:hypothetical protein